MTHANNRLQNILKWLLLIGLCGIPILVSHQTERTLWRADLAPQTLILNTAKIELTLVDLAIFAMLVGLIGVLLFARHDFLTHLHQTVLKVGGGWWILFGVWCLISVLWSAEPILTLFRSVHLLLAVLVAFSTAYAIGQGYGKWLIWAILIAAFVHSLIALAQYANDAPLGWTGLGELQRPPNAILGEKSTHLRAYGLSLHPNILAGFLMIGLLLSGILAQKSQRVIAGLILLMDVVILLAIFATGSRLILLLTVGAAILIGFVWLLSQSHTSLFDIGRIMALIAVVLVGGVVLLQSAFPSTWERLSELRSSEGVIDRVTFSFANTVPLLEDQPILGVGNGASIVKIGREWEGSSVLLLPAHNTYVAVWLEVGVVGIFLFVAGFVYLLSLMHPQNGTPVLIAGITLICTLVIMLFDYYFWGEPRSQVLLFWLIGILWGYSLTEK